jgi:type II secretory pathway component PulF
MRSLKPALLYFALVLGTGFVLGTIRVPFLVPRLGERYAELLEMPFLFVAIVLAARFIVRRFALPASLALRLRVGFLALVQHEFSLLRHRRLFDLHPGRKRELPSRQEIPSSP